MPKKLKRLSLTAEQQELLSQEIQAGTTSARRLKRAYLLLWLSEGRELSEIAAQLKITVSTIYNVRRRFEAEGLERALSEAPRPGKPPLLSARNEAQLLALACSPPPSGRQQWTLQLLAERVVALGLAEHFTAEAVRKRLKKTT